MDIVRVILLIITIVIIVGPIGGALIIYRNNLVDLIIPLELPGLIDDLTNHQPNVTYVKYSYAATNRTATLTFNVTNPYNFTVTISSLSADVECTDHSFTLGQIASENAQEIPAYSSRMVEISVVWTQAAVDHFQEPKPLGHSGETSIQVDLFNIVVDVKGISIEVPNRMTVPERIPIT